MVELTVGYLFKRKNISYKNQEYEIFELADYALAATIPDNILEKEFIIITGKYEGICSFDMDEGNNNSFIFIEQQFDHDFKAKDNNFNFKKIRKEKLSKTIKYYVRMEGKNGVVPLKNNELLLYLNESENNITETKESSAISLMYSSIKKTIISQDEQIMQILTTLFKNQKVVNSDLDMDLILKLKENILIYGSTGTGKTEILKRISKLFNIPIVIEDATMLSETGYVGRKITDMLEDLCLAANNNIELAEKGILVIDEFDKLAENSKDNQAHVSRLGVQRSLLKLLDGSLFYFNDKKFDTSKLTIVALGAFTDINIEKTHNHTNTIGFCNNVLAKKTNYDDYSKISNSDFIEYGIMRELIGRFSKTIAMNPLSKEDIIKILKESDFSPLNTYKKLFDILGIDFHFNDEFIEYIAELAIAKQTGARSLKTVFDDCISSALFKIFSGECSSISLVKPDDENDKPYILTKKK